MNTNDRDIEDTRLPPEKPEVDEDDLWGEVSDCLSKRLMEFVQEQVDSAQNGRAFYMRQHSLISARVDRIRKMIRGAYDSPKDAAIGVEELTFDEMEIALSKALHLIEEIYDELSPSK